MGANSLTWNRLPEGPLWLISPHLRVWQKQLLKQLRKRVPADPETIWIFSSGTRAINQIKCIGLKRAAILTAAAGANTHLQATRLDRWLIPIPTYHIGGFAILARAFLSGSAVEPMGRWLASDFITTITQRKITLTSLVPAQVYDLVRSRRRAPSSVRAIVVGGGALDPDLYVSARDLGWPLLPSYGLTESAAQVATAKLSSLHTRKFPDLAVLPHAQIELRASRIFIRSPSLCHWIATLDRNGVFTLEDPRQEGWLATEDLAEWDTGGMRVIGRRDEVVKVLGVLVPLAQVERDLGTWARKLNLEGGATILPLKAAREGTRLLLVTDTNANLRRWEDLVRDYNQKVSGPYRVSALAWVPEIPRTELQKTRKSELSARLWGAVRFRKLRTVE